MAKHGKWQALRSLGSGGQGETFAALDTERVNLETAANIAQRAVNSFQQIHPASQRPHFLKELAAAVQAVAATNDPANLGALKVFHSPKNPAGHEKAKERMANEVRAYEALTHPNLLRLVDKDLDAGWIVTEYQPLGALDRHVTRYRGDLLGALHAIRPIVDAVAALHRAQLVHRDIKPANVFLSAQGDLILGDAGLVFFIDQAHTRVSDKFENVGSRDWMPGWAMGVRVEQVRASFDVFSLGKLLWSMVAGQPLLPLWYHHKPPFELELMFPPNADMYWARWLLDRCIVEEESACLRDAGELLPFIDRAILALRRSAQVVGENIQRICTVCALGTYKYVVNEDTDALHNFGLQGSGSAPKIFSCDKCGHVQIFYMGGGRPPAWSSDK